MPHRHLSQRGVHRHLVFSLLAQSVSSLRPCGNKNKQDGISGGNLNLPMMFSPDITDMRREGAYPVGLVAERRHHDRFDGVHPVFRFIEDYYRAADSNTSSVTSSSGRKPFRFRVPLWCFQQEGGQQRINPRHQDYR